MWKSSVKHLPMGVSNSPDLFNQKMNETFRGFEFIWAYINYLLIIIKGDWDNHLEKLELILQNIQYNRLKCTIKKSFFGQTEMEYLGFRMTWNRIRLINKKVEAIENMIPPETTKTLRVPIDLVNYHRNIWDKRSHLIHPFPALTSNKLTLKWTDIEQETFDKIKSIVVCNNLLAYLDFNNFFDIHKAARD